MPVIAGIGPDGALVPIRATGGGLLEVDVSEDAEASGAQPELLLAILRELRETRRLFCECHELPFIEELS